MSTTTTKRKSKGLLAREQELIEQRQRINEKNRANRLRTADLAVQRKERDKARAKAAEAEVLGVESEHSDRDFDGEEVEQTLAEADCERTAEAVARAYRRNDRETAQLYEDNAAEWLQLMTQEATGIEGKVRSILSDLTPVHTRWNVWLDDFRRRGLPAAAYEVLLARLNKLWPGIRPASQVRKSAEPRDFPVTVKGPTSPLPQALDETYNHYDSGSSESLEP